MKSLSQSEYGELRSLYESVYAPKVETILEDFTDEDLDLTDQEIEEQVEEVFLECIEEGYDIDEIERAICEAVDAELQVLNEVTSPAKVAVARMKDKASGGDKPKMNVSKQKIGGSSEKKASTLSKVKSAASKVKSGLKTAGKVAQGTVGVTARAVGTAQRAASAVKSAAKKGYERGRYGPGGKPSSSSSSSDGGSSSGGGSSSSSSSSSDDSSSTSGGSSSSGSSDAPKKRKDGLLKRAIKKVVRGASKAVSTAAGAVKAGADSVTARARKEELEATGLFSDIEIEAIMEAEMSEGYDEPKMHSAVKRVMTTQPAAKGRAASRLHSKYSMRSKGNVAGETDGPGPNAPKRSGRKGRGSETDRGSGNAAKRRMEG